MTSFSRKLLLETRVRAADGAGGFSGGWTVLGTHWAQVRPGSGRLERGDEVARSRAGYRIKVRAVPQSSSAYPQPGQRFREGARIYAIRAVLMDADARFLNCLAEEEVAS